MSTGKIKTLYSDKEKTEALFPRTKINAISDTDGKGLDAILESVAYVGIDDSNTSSVPINVDTFGGRTPDEYVTQDNLTTLDYPVDSVNGKTGNVVLAASDVGARASTWLPTAREIGLLVYPVGSIYMSVNSTNPSTIFGGTWEQLQNRFLLGAGSSYANGATGGSATHTLTVDEMPSHSHSSSNVRITEKSGGPVAMRSASLSNNATDVANAVVSNTGGGAAHNNMPPYLVVYMWKRTA